MVEKKILQSNKGHYYLNNILCNFRRLYTKINYSAFNQSNNNQRYIWMYVQLKMELRFTNFEAQENF